MGIESKIEWCDDTVNLWWGRSKVHTGCKNCYAEHLSDVRYKGGLCGENKPRRIVKGAFPMLAKIEKLAKEEGRMRRVFIGSMMDIFEDSKPCVKRIKHLDVEQAVRIDGKWEDVTTHHLRSHLFLKIMKGEYDHIQFLFLTKHPENINKFIPDSWLTNPPENVMIREFPL